MVTWAALLSFTSSDVIYEDIFSFKPAKKGLMAVKALDQEPKL